MVDWKKFCCCLPVRLGVFVLSGLTGALAFISAASIWYTVSRSARSGLASQASITIDPNNPGSAQDVLDSIKLDKTQFISFIVAGTFLTFFFLFSVFGFIGTLIRKRSFVAIYAKFMWFFLGVSLAIGGLFLYAIHRNSNTVADGCTQVTSDNRACQVATKFAVGLYIAAFLIQWLVHLYACIIVKRYVEQLEDEQAYKSYNSGNKVHGGSGSGASSFYKHQPLGKHEHELPLFHKS